MTAYFPAESNLLKYKMSMYVDLSNFLGVLRDLLGIKEFKDSEDRYIELANALADSIRSLFVKSASLHNPWFKLIPFRLYCYGSYRGSERESFKAFKELVKNLVDAEVRLVERGRSEREKGVDIMLATDMLVHAVWNHYDVAFLVSGDADFEPLVRRVKDLGKKVYVRFFEFATSDKLKDASDNFWPIREDHLVTGVLAETIIMYFKDEFVSNLLDDLIKKIEERLLEPQSNSNMVNIINKVKTVMRHFVKVNPEDKRVSTILQTASSLIDELRRETVKAYLNKNNLSPKEFSRLEFALSFYLEIIRTYIG